MADEKVGFLDVVPNLFPNFRCRRASLIRQVSAHLDVATKYDRTDWFYLFRNLDKARHLRVVYNDNMRSALRARGKRSNFPLIAFDPGPVYILTAPVIQNSDLLLREAFFRRGNTLNNIMIVLCDTENLWVRPRDIPRRRLAATMTQGAI